MSTLVYDLYDGEVTRTRLRSAQYKHDDVTDEYLIDQKDTLTSQAPKMDCRGNSTLRIDIPDRRLAFGENHQFLKPRHC